MSRAVRLCPVLVIVPPDFAKYRAVSSRCSRSSGGDAARRAAVAGRGVSGRDRERVERAARARAWRSGLKREIRETTALTASAGVAPNKFLAKIASGWQKPDGLTGHRARRDRVVPPATPRRRAVGRGAGDRGEAARAIGIARLVDVRTIDPAVLQRAVGSHADWLRQLASGHDDRAVVADPPGEVVVEREHLRPRPDGPRPADEHRGDGARRRRVARPQGISARTVTIKVRYDDFTTMTRSHTPAATCDADALAARAVSLLDKTEAGTRRRASARRQRAQPRYG